MRFLGIIVAICGFGWAFIGAANVFIMLLAVSEDKMDSEAGAVAFIVNAVIFGLPGLVVASLGMLVARKS